MLLRYAKSGMRPSGGQNGFTLIEILIAFGLFVIVTSVSIVSYGNLMPATDLRESAYHLAQDLRRAKAYSISARGNSSFGVYIDQAAKTAVLYQGDSFASRTAANDQLYRFSGQVTITLPSGQGDFHFTKYTGMPERTGTIVVSNDTGSAQSIAINQIGVIDFN